MSQTDLEYWIINFTDKIKTTLNEKIDCVSALKVKDDTRLGLDAIELQHFDDCAYFYQDFGIEATNFDCFVLFKWGTQLDVTAGGEGAEKASLVTTLYIGDELGTDSEKQARMLLRYRRALKASIKQAYRELSPQGLKILSLPDGLYEITNRHMWALPVVSEFYFAG